MRISRKYPIILNGIGATAILMACLGLLGMLVPIGGFLGSWFATHTDLIQAVTALLGVTGLITGILSYLWRRKLRTDDFPFAIIDPYKHDEILPTIFRVTDLKNPLSAHYVPYQTGRAGGEDIQSKMQELLQSKHRLIIKGPTGVGKTREGGELAATLCKEGWAVIVLKKEGERIWLGRPEKWPPIDEKRIVVFLDDLHTLCNPAIQSQSPLADTVPFAPNPPFQDRLMTFLEYLEELVGDKVPVIATARSEPEQWRKLDPNNPFWDSFAQYEIRRFSDEAGGKILEDYAKQLNVPLLGSAIELARKSDGLADTLVRNVQVASQKGQTLDAKTLMRTAKGSYEEIYQGYCKDHPDETEAINNLYVATYIVREFNLPLHEELVLGVAVELFKSPKVASLFYKSVARKALNRLLGEPRWWEKQNNLLIVRDGVLEGKTELPNPYSHLDEIIGVVGRLLNGKKRETADVLHTIDLSYLARAKQFASTVGSSVAKSLFPVYQLLYSIRPVLINASPSQRIVLVQYFVTGESIFLFGIRADWDEPAIVEIKQPPSEIRQYVKDYFGLEQVTKGGSTAHKVIGLDLDEWQERFAPLLSPIQEWSEPGDYLYIVPHDVLHYIPFHALNIEGGYLIERNPVVYLPTPSLLNYCQGKRKGRREKALVFGDADPRFTFPGAREEAMQIARLFNTQPFLGQRARKSTLKEKLEKEDIDILHFACYGYADPDEPHRSGIVMAPIAGEEDVDDIHGLPIKSVLTVEEIYKLEITADLVTLSADVTGYSELRPGDELMGLVRAFLYAGVPSVVGSQWGVYDFPTRLFMVHFYENLKAGFTKAEALQKAQLYLKGLTAADAKAYYEEKVSDSTSVDGNFHQKQIGESIQYIYNKLLEAEEREGHPVGMDYHIFNHPAYWAPFILVGDWK